MNFFYAKEFEIGYVLAVLKYRLRDIIKSNKLYLLYITVYMRTRISPPQKEFFNY